MKLKLTFPIFFMILSSQSFAFTVQVEQGSVAQWSGSGASACYYDGKKFNDVDGSCFYPIDMNAKPAYYEVGRLVNGTVELATLEVITKQCTLEEIDFPKTEYVTLSKEDAERHWSEQWKVKMALRKEKPAEPMFLLPLANPADPLPQGDNFGVCRKFNGIDKHRHTGVDYAIGSGHNVLAIADGVVSLAEDHFFSGKAVYVNHGNGLTSMSFHMSNIDVQEGQSVKQGDILGQIGSTGRSTGPHLHLGVRWHNQRVDPNVLMQDPGRLPQIVN
jgi:murein DD-endopeptidase MepM/ murein hydrolase activator NlpD